MSDKNYYRETSKKVDLEYPDLKELDRIELFGLLKNKGEEKEIQIKDFKLSQNQKNFLS